MQKRKTLSKRGYSNGVFPWILVKKIKNTFSAEHLQVTVLTKVLQLFVTEKKDKKAKKRQQTQNHWKKKNLISQFKRPSLLKLVWVTSVKFITILTLFI